jgi:hypothetical protein
MRDRIDAINSGLLVAALEDGGNAGRGLLDAAGRLLTGPHGAAPTDRFS